MCRRVALRSSLRIILVLLIGVALLPAPCVSMLVSAMGQGQGRSPRTGPPPRPGKPEGVFPDLDDVKSSIEREPPAPIPSTIRSQRNSGRALGRAACWRSAARLGPWCAWTNATLARAAKNEGPAIAV